VAVALQACAPARATQAVAAQSAPAPAAAEPRAELVVSGSASVDVVPDRATLSVAVETRGNSAAEAAAANARVQTAILEAIKRTGVAPAQLRTTALSVQPEYQYPERGGRPTVVGYSARNSVEVEIRDLTKTGAVVDAALASGATNIAGPNFFAADPTIARRAALEKAVAKARAEAEVVALAAGVRLGRVLEIRLDDASVPEPSPIRFRTMAAEAAQTPVETGTLSVTASVTIRFAIATP
jgi:uncharacterized protein YggE